jgi:hypothetical protein
MDKRVVCAWCKGVIWAGEEALETPSGVFIHDHDDCLLGYVRSRMDECGFAEMIVYGGKRNDRTGIY